MVTKGTRVTGNDPARTLRARSLRVYAVSRGVETYLSCNFESTRIFRVTWGSTTAIVAEGDNFLGLGAEH